MLKQRHLVYVMAALMLTGVATVMRRIVFPLFATGQLDVTVGQLGLLQGTTVAVGTLVSVLVGRVSDGLRRRDRLVVLVCLWLAIGNVATTFSPGLGTLFLVEVLFTAFVSVPLSQLFALGGEQVRVAGFQRPQMMTGALRASFSLGFALGPMIAALATSASGDRGAMIWVAAPWLVAGIIVWRFRGRTTVEARPASGKPAWGARLVLFFLAFLLMSVVDVTRTGFLSVFARQSLGLSITEIGLLFSLTSLLNLALMPLAGALADRLGARRVVLMGVAAGVLGALATASAGSLSVLLLGAALHSVYSAGVFAVGISFAQDMSPGRPGFGIGVYSAALQLGSLMGMVAGGLVAQSAGWTSLFVLSAVTGSCGMILLALMPAARR